MPGAFDWAKLVDLNAKMTVGTPSDNRQGGRLSHSRMDDAVRRLGRFQIIGRLATGGMAEVYLALSGELPGYRTLLVVKRILPHLASNRQFIGMFDVPFAVGRQVKEKCSALV